MGRRDSGCGRVDFIGIGAQKSGTSWLHQNLSCHPEIYFPGGKEVHFWDRRQNRDLSWYAELFGAVEGKRQGDITPAYAVLDQVTISEVHEFSPESRLIYLVRNPIDRSWSHALMRVKRMGLDYQSLPDGWFSEMVQSPECASRSDHETVLKNWLAEYPEEQLCVLLFDDIATDPRSLLERVCRHIDVDPKPLLEISDPGIRVFEGLRYAIRPAIWELLTEIYEPKIRDLSTFLGLDLSDWLRRPDVH